MTTLRTWISVVIMAPLKLMLIVAGKILILYLGLTKNHLNFLYQRSNFFRLIRLYNWFINSPTFKVFFRDIIMPVARIMGRLSRIECKVISFHIRHHIVCDYKIKLIKISSRKFDSFDSISKNSYFIT